MGKKQSRRGKYFYLLAAGILIVGLALLSGCAHLCDSIVAEPAFDEAGRLANRGSCRESLVKYDRIVREHPSVGDRALFEGGLVCASSANQQRDYQKAADYFQKLIKIYPSSKYRRPSEIMLALIQENLNKDKAMSGQRKQMDKLEQQMTEAKQEITELGKKIEQMKIIDMNLNAKKKTTP